MEPKDTLSLCSDSDEQDMQQMLKRTKILKDSFLNSLGALNSNFTQKQAQGITKSEFERAFSHIFGEDVDIFTRMFSQNMDALEQQLTKDTIIESNCQNAFRVLKTQFEKIFTSVLIKPSSLDDDEYVVMTRNYFLQYTKLEIPEFHNTLIQHMEYVKKSIVEKAQHKREYDNRDTSSRSGNDAHDDDADIIPIYDEEPIAEVQTTAKINVFAIGQQHTKQPEFNNEGEKCVFNANNDHFLTKFLNEVNSRAKVPANKTTNKNKPAEKITVAKKPERHIPKGHRFSIKKTSVVHEKTMTHRSCLRWKSTGKVFKTVGLRLAHTRKLFTSSTTKVDSEPTNGSNEDITDPYEYEQILNVSASTLNLSASISFNPKKEGLRVCLELKIHDHNNEPSSLKLVLKVDPPADKTATSRQELELLFHHHITMLSLIPAESDSLPHAHAQTTKTYYKHQDSSIKKAQELKTKTFANSDIKDTSSETNLRGRLLETFKMMQSISLTLESRYVYEGRTINPSFYNDLSDDSVAKFTAIGFDCLISLDEQICPRQPFNLAYFIIRRMYFFRDRRDKVLPYGMILTRLFKNLKTNMTQGLFDECYKLIPRKMSSLKAKQPKRPLPKRTRNVGKSKRTQLSTSSSTESLPSDNRDLPSTNLSPWSYYKAHKNDPNMSKEQRETRGMFKNLARALHNFARMLKKGCR
uniref:Uncharacterized protein n=1 Tax=Tanacetum cinerariifolium TaxID=118510 RepID=A0A6L2L7L2_TANCI|nr:hypothetical protein [Tanacetum cinerariifolium]